MSTPQSVSSSASVNSSAKAGSSKLLMFRVLTLVGAGLMLLSWFMPWWMATIDALHDATITIRPWGLDNTFGPDMAKMVENAAMPVFFAPMMWAYLAACMIALILSLVLKDRAIGLGKIKLSLPRVLLGGVGLSYMIALVVAVVFASMRMDTPAFYNMKFIGYTRIVMDVEMAAGGVTADLLPGYYVAWVAGVFMVVLALFRNKLVGSKPA
jgi:hypothetical protein